MIVEENAAASAFGASERPMTVGENRRMKACGLGLIVGGAAGLSYIINRSSALASFTAAEIVVTFLVGLFAANVIGIGGIVLRSGFGDLRVSQQRRRRRAIGLQMIAANLLAPAVTWAVISDQPAVIAHLEAAGWEGWPDAAGLLLMLFAWRIWRRSRRHEALSADEAMAHDPRPPVLYLRSFRDDGEPLGAGGTAYARWLMRTSRAHTAEEAMASILEHVGPVIAIGKPGEPLPELGAARLYVSHEDWQQRVIELMQQARLIVVRVGSSPGVLWEIEQALTEVARHRLVIVVLDTAAVAPELLTRLAPAVGPSLDGALSEAPVRGWTTGIRNASRRVGGLIWFQADGTARLRPIQRELASLWNVRDLRWQLPDRRALERAWSETLGELRLVPPTAGSGRSRALAVTLAVLLGAFGAHWFYLGNRRRAWIHVMTVPVLMLPMFVAWIDAIRIVLADRAQFDTQFVRH